MSRNLAPGQELSGVVAGVARVAARLPCRQARGYRDGVVDFALPADLSFNRGPIADPEAFARDADARSWLFICGEDWAAMDEGMSYAQVQAAVPEAENI